MSKAVPRASMALFAAGVFFLLNSQINITGAVAGIAVGSSESSTIGASLIFAAGLVYLDQKSENEKNRELFVKHHFRAYRIHLENIGDKNIMALPEYKRDTYARDKLYEITSPEESIPSERRIKNEALELLEHRQIPTKVKELMSIARRMGFELKGGGDHLKVYRSDALVTEIPTHPEINRYTAKKILGELSANAPYP